MWPLLATSCAPYAHGGWSKLHGEADGLQTVCSLRPGPMGSWDDSPFPAPREDTWFPSLQTVCNSYLLALKTPTDA